MDEAEQKPNINKDVQVDTTPPAEQKPNITKDVDTTPLAEQKPNINEDVQVDTTPLAEQKPNITKDVDTTPLAEQNPNINEDVQVDTTPLDPDDLSKVTNELYPVAAKWKNLGLALGLKHHVLDNIEARNRGNPTSCLTSVIDEWLKKNYNEEEYSQPTWQWLVKAVGNPVGGENKSLAKKIAINHKAKGSLRTEMEVKDVHHQDLGGQKNQPEDPMSTCNSTTSSNDPCDNPRNTPLGSIHEENPPEASEPSSESSQRTVQGYLYRRGQMKRWTKVYCIIRDRILECYNTRSSSKPELEVDLLRSNVVEDADVSREWAFKMKHGKKDVHFAAESREDYEWWMKALQLTSSIGVQQVKSMGEIYKENKEMRQKYQQGSQGAHYEPEILEHYGHFASHYDGIFRKKVTIAKMLSWAKDPISTPMIVIEDKERKKDALHLFKLVQKFMGDSKEEVNDEDEIALKITTMAFEHSMLRDELFVQLCKQTTNNASDDIPKSLTRGWQLFTVCLAFFLPTPRFEPFLDGYLGRHVTPQPEYCGVPVEKYAKYCHRQLRRSPRTSTEPTTEGIKLAKAAPLQCSVFGTTLEVVMGLQEDKYPNLSIPWFIEELTKAVLKLNGSQTEGIFSVSGDRDKMNTLKLQLDEGFLSMTGVTDPHIPASLLKVWFKELREPLIPPSYYQKFIDNCEDKENAVSLVGTLPPLNNKLLLSLLSFLKKFITLDKEDRMKKKISMVWAPIILRCPTHDDNSYYEVALLECLLDTH